MFTNSETASCLVIRNKATKELFRFQNNLGTRNVLNRKGFSYLKQIWLIVSSRIYDPGSSWYFISSWYLSFLIHSSMDSVNSVSVKYFFCQVCFCQLCSVKPWWSSQRGRTMSSSSVLSRNWRIEAEPQYWILVKHNTITFAKHFGATLKSSLNNK